jgi:hypothetical protein
MSYGNSGDEKLIEREFFFTFRKDAWDVEQTLLDHFDDHRAFPKFSNDPMMPLGGRGQTELFRHDILGLDDDLYKLPNEEELLAIRGELAEAKDGCLFILVGLVLAPFTLGISLFFIVGGVSSFFGFDRTPRSWLKRPSHPPNIQALIDSLCFR